MKLFGLPARPATLVLALCLLCGCVGPAAGGPPLPSGSPAAVPVATPAPFTPSARASSAAPSGPAVSTRPAPGTRSTVPTPAPTPVALRRPWYHPAHSGKTYVNPDLTVQRVLHAEVPQAWNGQLVLWQGRIRSQVRDGKATDVVLGTTAGDVPIRFRFKAINLETDRTGFRVAIKASLRIEGGRMVALDGHSMILLQPPLTQDYATWLRSARGRTSNVQSFLVWWVGFHNPGYTPELCETIASAIVSEAAKNSLDPLFFASLVQIESAFRVDAVSPSGAQGLGQLMPFVSRSYGVDALNPRENLRASAKMIGGLVRAWTPRATSTQVNSETVALRGHHPWGMALASYNAGPTLVRNTGRIPAIPQTTNYVYFIGFVHQNMTATAARLGHFGDSLLNSNHPRQDSRMLAP